MRKSEVEIGGLYIAKISNKLTTVRIHNESMYGGWNAKNEATGRWIRIKSAAKLRGRAYPDGSANFGPQEEYEPSEFGIGLGEIDAGGE